MPQPELDDRQLCASLEKRLAKGAAMLDAEWKTHGRSDEFSLLEYQFLRMLNTYMAASSREQWKGVTT